jgi:hypothetical protein
MIIQHRETTDGHRKDLCKFFEAVLNPLLRIVVSLAQDCDRKALQP